MTSMTSNRGLLIIPFILLILSSCPKTQLPILRPSESVTQKGIYHIVEKGQTLWRICRAYGVSMQEVAEINGIYEPTAIKVGQRIFIPGATRVLKVLPYQKWPEKPPKLVKKKGRFQWPLKGRITSSFGIRNGQKHNGIDIAAPRGTPVKAASSGTVIYRGRLKGYGKLIIVKHLDGHHTVYAHLDQWRTKVGKVVAKGQVIGTVGRTGRSSGYHLHFEIRYKNRTKNPLFYLP